MNFKVIKLVSQKSVEFLYKISASEITDPVSYLFFLTLNGRYIADMFLIKDDFYYIISKSFILENFLQYIKKFNLRNEFQFEETNLFLNFHENGKFEDPRGVMNFYLSQNFVESENYHLIRYSKKIVEFEEFEIGKSIVLEYGQIAKFISFTKGCYIGQELMQHLKNGVIRKYVDVVENLDENVVRILSNFKNQYFVLKRL